jgi:hypothetical protein
VLGGGKLPDTLYWQMDGGPENANATIIGIHLKIKYSRHVATLTLNINTNISRFCRVAGGVATDKANCDHEASARTHT